MDTATRLDADVQALQVVTKLRANVAGMLASGPISRNEAAFLLELDHVVNAEFERLAYRLAHDSTDVVM
jgi:hypothetical protein